VSEHTATIRWTRRTPDFAVESFDRNHEWTFDSGVVVPASSAPAYRGDPSRVDPEEALVAALCGCHMLTFLFVAARKKFVVDSYEDAAVGVMTRNAQGKFWISRVTLRPSVVFAADKRPTPEEFAALHHAAHEDCFIAQSVKTEVVIDPQLR
jgi:organic hydroperoxide reductase OsmC/OhrA